MKPTRLPNTTERIQACGGRWRGAPSFTAKLNANNPHSGQHWLQAITNNPGGCVPKLNPDWFEERVARLADEVSRIERAAAREARA